MVKAEGLMMVNFWNGYVDWANFLFDENTQRSTARSASQTATDLFEPIFVSSREQQQSLKQSIRADRDLMLPRVPNYSPFTESAGFTQTFVYVRYGTPRERSFYEVLHVGLPVNIDEGSISEPDLVQISSTSDEPPVALGIIDDGIGFLNERFRQPGKPSKSRIAAIWVQSLASKRVNGRLRLGKVLDRRTINNKIALADMIGEEAVYRNTNQDIYPPGLTHVVEQAGSHGTHILDLALGLDPNQTADSVSDVPIFAVQLPPDSIDDTSGTRLETHLLMGLRWLIANAQENNIPNLVVNASLGVTAGPKNGRKFLETQIAAEIERAGSQNPKVEVSVVFPFGNDHEDRQIATMTVAKEQTQDLELILQPDDLTASFVEVRPLHRTNLDDLEKLKVQIKGPSGQSWDLSNIPQDTYKPLKTRSADNIGRFYHVGQRPVGDPGDNVSAERPKEDPYLILALAPTAPFSDGDMVSTGTLAPAGSYHLSFSTDTEHEFEISVQIQRDDSAVGFSQRGRQAFFDHPAAYDYSTKFRDFSALRPSPAPITYSGTNSAYTTLAHDRVFSVGAAVVCEGKTPSSPDVLPARYASKGADWTVTQPDGSAVSEDSYLHSGIIASGSMSGSSSVFSGSSTAAASYSRQLILEKLANAAPLPIQDNQAYQERLGPRTIVDNPSIFKR